MTGSIVAIVLAGGASRRFGSDKLAADLGGRPLLHHAIEAVAAVADRLVLVLAPHSPVPPLPPALDGRIAVVHDHARHGGPLAGLVAGLESGAAVGVEVAIVVGGDMPTLVPGVLRLLAERLLTDANVDAMTLGASPPAPLPMAVRTAGVGVAAAAGLTEGRRSLRSLLDAVPSGEVPEADWRPLDADGRTLSDIDTPEDLEAAGPR